MVLQNHNSIAARTLAPDVSSSSNSGNTMTNRLVSTTRSASTGSRSRSSEGMGSPKPLIDLLVAMIAIPVLILCALQLEKNLHEMVESAESRWLVFALGIGMLIVSVIICGYVTHRMGVCMWAGPIDENGHPATLGNRHHHSSSHTSGNSSQTSTTTTSDFVTNNRDVLPPSYESVVKFDIPPPSYECLVIDMEPNKEALESRDKESQSDSSNSM